MFGRLEIFQDGALYGVKVKNNKTVIIPPEYDKIGLYHNDMIEVQKNGKWGVYTDKGILVVEPKYDEIGIFF